MCLKLIKDTNLVMPWQLVGERTRQEEEEEEEIDIMTATPRGRIYHL